MNQVTFRGLLVAPGASRVFLRLPVSGGVEA